MLLANPSHIILRKKKLASSDSNTTDTQTPTMSCWGDAYFSDHDEDFSDEEDYEADGTDSSSQKERALVDAILEGDSETVRNFIQNGTDVNAEITFARTTALCMADERGDSVIVRILLDAGADVRWIDGSGASALVRACSHESLSIVQMIFDHDKDLLEIADEFGHTPLLMAILDHRSSIVQFLLDQGANVHAMTRDGTTTLAAACRTGDVGIARRMLAAGIGVEERDTDQRTALHDVAWSDSFQRAKLMRELILQHNANMFAVDNRGRTPFDAGRGTILSTDYVRNALIEIYGSKLQHENGSLALHALLLAAEYELVEGVDFRPPLALNALQITLPLGKLTLQHLRTLLSTLDTELIHNRDDRGKLPIHIACKNNAPVEVLDLLLEDDAATLHIADYSGALPLHECCRENVEYGRVRFLVEQGGVGTLAARDHQGALPLHALCASTNPSLLTVQYLIQSFPESVSAPTVERQYPFMIAACESSVASLSVVYELVRANPDVGVPR